MHPVRPIPALLMGSTGRLPFKGHLRDTCTRGGAVLSAAGCLAADAGVETALVAARSLKVLLAGLVVPDEPPADRFTLLRAAWQALALVPGLELGPAEGADLTLLLVSRDAEGVAVAGVGLAAVWGRRGDTLTPLVPRDHPLLAPAGRPQGTPGVLNVSGELDAVVGCPVGVEVPSVAGLDVDGACGVRR